MDIIFVLKKLKRVPEDDKTEIEEFIKEFLNTANGGSLRDYLALEFQNMNGKEKLRMAQELARGFNVFINKPNDSSKSCLANELKGQPACIDPQCFKDEQFIRNKKSDIYALGVLLWELTSGRSPFKNTKKWTLMFQIAYGIRETPIEKTLTEYIALYKRCWIELLDKRPSINEVNEKLKGIQWNLMEFGTCFEFSNGLH
ncbi:hypothetical protein G9A89_005502 [Geosiphon pyriformis]|nr:hypothetical protein G9A89_005502 [Geosiphon pyriformis]